MMHVVVMVGLMFTQMGDLQVNTKVLETKSVEQCIELSRAMNKTKDPSGHTIQAYCRSVDKMDYIYK